MNRFSARSNGGWFENRAYIVIETEETKWPLGLHPRLVPVIVAKAHAAGLQVTAHVETAEDFRHAVRSGVDEIAPVPRMAGDQCRRWGVRPTHGSGCALGPGT